jgi:four helix bundle protein
MPVRNYVELFAWQKAFDLAIALYKETDCFPIEERYGITAQIRKAGISIPSKIAEGEGRKSRAEFRHFLSIAHGSLREVETQILIADKLEYFDNSKANILLTMIAEVGPLITGRSGSLR